MTASNRCLILAVAVLIPFACAAVADTQPAPPGPTSTAIGDLKSASPGDDLTIFLVGHAHIDFAYRWPWTETLDVLKNTFGTLSKLMDEYPFVFSQSQAALYEQTKRSYPQIYEKIKERVKRGQWDVSTASSWSEGDKNMASGESIVRGYLLANRFIRKEFGIEPTVGWEPDTFGHAWTLPQILSKSGIKYYYFMRKGPGPPLFRWQAPDHSQVTCFSMGSYNQGIEEQELRAAAVDFAKRTHFTNYMRVFGVGDHGGGPTRRQLQTITDLKQRPSYPKLQFRTALDYFTTSRAAEHTLPVVNTELNPIFEGCYTAHADAKRYNRDCENSLAAAETLSAVAAHYGVPYPADGFRSSWKKACFNQFHDILDGSAIHAAYDYAKTLHDEVKAQAVLAQDAAVSALAKKIDTRGKGIPIVVFNPLAWARTDCVTCASPFPGQDAYVAVRDQSGKVYPARTLGNRLTFTARDVPALGYKVYWVTRVAKPVPTGVSIKGPVVENQFFRVTIEPHLGVITGIYDKVNHREALVPKQYSGLLQVLLEGSEKESGKASAWRIGNIQGTQDLLDTSEVVHLDTGPAKCTVWYDHRYDQSLFTQELTLYDGVPRIDIKLTADWQQPWQQGKPCPFLKAAFSPHLNAPKATFEIPFGSIERPTDGREVVGQKWIDLSDSGYGVSLLNDCKYGFDVKRNTMRISLLRSSHDPDPNPDQGLHEMTFSIYPHKGDWRQAGTVRRGYELNEPLVAKIATSHAGSLPASKSFLSVSASNVVVTALKKAEDDASYILRFYETAGKPVKATFTLNLPARAVVETDLMERPIGKEIPVKGKQFSVSVGKWEIKTYKIVR